MTHLTLENDQSKERINTLLELAECMKVDYVYGPSLQMILTAKMVQRVQALVRPQRMQAVVRP